MKECRGAAAICVNDKREVLVVRGMGTDLWSVPSGGIEPGESPEECCIREVKEETGCVVEILRRLRVKQTVIQGIAVTTYYFNVERSGGKLEVNDPDQNIEEACWKSIDDLSRLPQLYPEDLPLIQNISQSFNKIT
ncbi:NUDIX domain-containing protein [Rossellomorea vietnamensis]|uniref:NUDIX domain-containing protein n=1 Tax=Rossellomorea vietnamensis TaxID=218284 RepID=A0A5D4MFT4_9BACI|nr:NUDIX domain-containing protein [Rossellomorea vietnamensis]TYS00319.1 NUDIX domain-containing protein [Rossellomorea vietnamensis]